MNVMSDEALAWGKMKIPRNFIDKQMPKSLGKIKDVGDIASSL